MSNTPKHVAIIMDGNGRWAQRRLRPRTYGHVKGTRVAKKIITHASRLGIKWLTLYAFSTENWSRPATEVSLLMRILLKYLDRETENLVKENIRLHVIGEVDKLPADIREVLQKSMAATAACTGLNLVFCLSYGSRQEITAAAQALAAQCAAGTLKPSDITPEMLGRSLWTHPAPDPELIIRTSGEERLSNFLLWQSAYSEFWFTNTLWPDFTEAEFNDALADYSKRSRRFGGLKNELISATGP